MFIPKHFWGVGALGVGGGRVGGWVPKNVCFYAHTQQLYNVNTEMVYDCGCVRGDLI